MELLVIAVVIAAYCFGKQAARHAGDKPMDVVTTPE